LSQRAAFGAFTTTSAASSQESSVQATPSSITGGVPAWQSSTGSQTSAPSQKSPLSQRAAFGAFTTASATSSQESSVQATPSSTEGGVPGWQPATGSQVSTPLQKRPSSQLDVLTHSPETHWSTVSRS